MEFKQLEAFVHVVELSSFSKAADMIFLSQPTISAHIGALEKELGVQLLIRSTKTVYPTKSGLEFYRYAKNILAMRDQAIYNISSLDKNTVGEIDILSCAVPAQYLLPAIIAGFQRSYPSVVIRVHQTFTETIPDALDGFQYDFAIVDNTFPEKKITCTPFYKDRAILIAPKSFGINVEDIQAQLRFFLVTHPFILWQESPYAHQILQGYLQTLGLTLENLQIVGSFEDTLSVVNAVTNGMGMAFVSKLAVSVYKEMEQVEQLDIDRATLSRQFYIAQREDLVLSPLLTLLTEYIRNFYGTQF